MCMYNIKKRICNILHCPQYYINGDVPKPDIVGTTNIEGIRTILKDSLGNIPIYLPDRYYVLPTKESVEEFLRYDNTSEFPYTGDNPDGGFDCDNYAARLWGNMNIPSWASIPKAVVWLSTPAHAVNIIVDSELDVYYIEPQTDQLMLVKDKTNWVPYVAIL